MNRRKFLRGLGVASVAIPFILLDNQAKEINETKIEFKDSTMLEDNNYKFKSVSIKNTSKNTIYMNGYTIYPNGTMSVNLENV